MANTSSIMADTEPIDVLIALHPKFNLMDFAGPVEVLNTAKHDSNNQSTRAFEITVVGSESQVLSDEGILVGSQILYREAHERLSEFDVLIVLGGNIDAVIREKTEPMGLVKAFSELQKKDPSRERTLMSICTGSTLLADLGILAGLSATTHPNSLTHFENICSQAATRELAERTNVVDDARYVVNNLRFDLGDEDENPYVHNKPRERRHSTARKGSTSWKGSNTRRESIARRAAMRLGGLRVITSGGIGAGIDATLYLVSAMVSEESAIEVANFMQVTWTKGIVVDGLDV